MVKVSVILILIALNYGCSSTQSSANKKILTYAGPSENSPTPVEVAAKKHETLVRLEKLIETAKSSGPAAVRYLGSDIFLKASYAGKRGDAETASLLYKYLLMLKPKDDFIREKYAFELIRKGDIEGSMGPLEEVFENSEHTNERAGLTLASVFASLGKLDMAKDIYLKILKKDSKNVPACVFLAKSYASENNYKQAFKRLNRCEKHSNGEGEYAYYKGKFYLEQDKKKLARKQFKKSLKINKYFYKSALGIGLLHEEKGEIKAALNVYKNYVEDDRYNSIILSRLTNILFSEGQFEEVIPYAETLSSLDPSDLNLKVKLGILYTDVKRYREAINVFKDILKVVPNSDKVLYYLGAIFQEIREYENSINYYGKVNVDSSLFYDSNIQIAEMLRGFALKKDQEEKDEARQRFFGFVDDMAGKYENLKVDMTVFKAGYFEEMGKIEMAIDSMQSIREEKNYTENQDYYLASLLDRVKRTDEAESVILDILDKNPDNAHALNFLGYTYLERGIKLDKAREYLEKAISLRPEDGYIRDSLGWYFYKTNNLQRALEEIKIAVEKAGHDVVILKHLAIIYQAMKQYNLARKYYGKALDVAQDENTKNSIMDAIQEIDRIRLPASDK